MLERFHGALYSRCIALICVGGLITTSIILQFPLWTCDFCSLWKGLVGHVHMTLSIEDASLVISLNPNRIRIWYVSISELPLGGPHRFQAISRKFHQPSTVQKGTSPPRQMLPTPEPPAFQGLDLSGRWLRQSYGWVELVHGTSRTGCGMVKVNESLES